MPEQVSVSPNVQKQATVFASQRIAYCSQITGKIRDIVKLTLTINDSAVLKVNACYACLSKAPEISDYLFG